METARSTFSAIGEAAALPRLNSKLGTEPAMRAHVLSAIATDFCGDVVGLSEFMDTTFYAHQRGDLSAVIDNVLDFLEAERMIIRTADRLRATELGRLTSRLYIDPLSASIIREGAGGRQEEAGAL